jgi:hypothetical protein
MKNKDPVLFDEPKKPDKAHITQLFYYTVDKAARVTCFARTAYPYWTTDIGVRIDALARDDLINFAISARRLLEAANFVTRARNISLSLLLPAQNGKKIYYSRVGTTSMWRMLNLLIHSKSLETFRSESQLRIFSRVSVPFEDSYYRIISGRTDSHPPIVLVVPDKGKEKWFDLAELLEVFEHCLSEIVSHCADHDIYLGVDWEF